MLNEVRGAKTFNGALRRIITPEARDQARAHIATQAEIGNNAAQAATFAAQDGDIRAVAAIIVEGGVRRPFGKGLMLAAADFRASAAETFSRRARTREEDLTFRNQAVEARAIREALDKLPT